MGLIYNYNVSNPWGNMGLIYNYNVSNPWGNMRLIYNYVSNPWEIWG